MEAVKTGADFVYGVDGEPTYIEQANFVFEASNIEPERYKFAVGDVIKEDLTELGSFDIVLCLGLLYHIATPIELFENVSKASSDILLIDTGVSSRSGNVVELRREILDDPRDNVNYAIAMFPTRRAVLDMVGLFGYEG